MGVTACLVSGFECSWGSRGQMPMESSGLRLLAGDPNLTFSKGQPSNQWAVVVPLRHLVLRQQIRHEWSFKQGLAFNLLDPSGNTLPALKGF